MYTVLKHIITCTFVCSFARIPQTAIKNSSQILPSLVVLTRFWWDTSRLLELGEGSEKGEKRSLRVLGRLLMF